MPEAIVVESVGKVILVVENLWETFNALLPRRTTSECLVSPRHLEWVIYEGSGFCVWMRWESWVFE